MNEFEQRTREAMASLRNKTYPQTPSIGGQLGGAAAQAAGISFSARELAAKFRPGNSGLTGRAEPDVGPEVPAATDEAGALELLRHRSALSSTGSTHPHSRSALSRPGVLMGHWDNPLIAAAMPTLLLAERARGQRELNLASVRSQFVREIQQFQQTFLKSQVSPEDVDALAYLVCSYVDETCLNTLDSGGLNLSLLVEFYRDASGGEKCFDHLQYYVSATPCDEGILAFYDLILSLGFKGKYHVMERGPVLLADIRNHLDNALYSQNPTETLTDAGVNKVVRKVRWISPAKLMGFGAMLLLLAYGTAAWYLHDQSQALRNAILAWSPPLPRKINIIETLPQPLPKILSEGWLEVRADPRGWLLIFTSDGAFAKGQARLSQEFKQKRNIERLGEALAPWPGDLEVIGHTDNTPFRNSPSNSNLKLSEARAQTVADNMRGSMQSGKYQRSVTSVGKGDAEPLDTNDTEQGRSRNRRVDILWKIGEREVSPPVDLNSADVSVAP